jgi:hypothetical protein
MGQIDRAFGVVDAQEIPQYPIARGERLEAHSYFPFHYQRFLNSDLYLLADLEVRALALELWCLSQNQDPVGTLPEDPRLLSALLRRMSVEDWGAYMRRDPNPLHGWVPCLVEGQRRLMHPVITENAMKVLGMREKASDRRSADAERQRMKRLRDAVGGLGLARFQDNQMFLAQLDALLEERHPQGNRTTARLVRALEELGVRDLGR